MATALTAAAADKPIDRKALVGRNNPVITTVDTLASLSVGNGGFAFTTDITGLQTFPEYYRGGVPLGTQSEWGWHSFDNPEQYRIEESYQMYDFGHGHRELYATQPKSGRAKGAADWYRANPHRLHLGCIGLEIAGLKPADIQKPRQVLDMWTGRISSEFKVKGAKYQVQTVCHPKQDLISSQITGQQPAINLRFPYPTGGHSDDACDWNQNDKHQTELVNQTANSALLKRTVGKTVYYVSLSWEGQARLKEKSKNYWLLASDGNQLTFTCHWSAQCPTPPTTPTSPTSPTTPTVYIVSEDGASVYSASKVARDEFPDEDVTVRGAVSIGRRLMDPLAELVKIDPKSIGVGQYQHDVDQAKLKHALDQTVESSVNLVGVNLNTASQHLLTYVSGLGPVLAQNIVDYRRQHGAFASRAELKKVPRLGPAAFQQCAGFLRIPHAKNPLDNSAVHPESYHIVEQMARDQHCTVDDLISNKALRQQIDIQRYVSQEVGLPTLTDILNELEKPGRDPRQQIEEFEFDSSVQTIDDLHEGMELPGIVTNITNFGAFVDIGVHQDGLVHVSQLADRYVSDPTLVVHLHQHVRVRVIGVDLRRQRISLSMKGL